MGRGGSSSFDGAVKTRAAQEQIDPDACSLRELRSEDRQVISKWLDDRAIMHYAGGRTALDYTEDPRCESLVLTDADDRVVGFATLEPCLGGRSPMCLVATDPELRGQGLGIKLFEELAEWGRENTEFGLVWGEVNKENEACVNAYQAAGWTEVEEDEDGYVTICSGTPSIGFGLDEDVWF